MRSEMTQRRELTPYKGTSRCQIISSPPHGTYPLSHKPRLEGKERCYVQAKNGLGRRAAGQTGRAVEPSVSRRHRFATANQASLLERQRTPVHGPAPAVR